MSPEGRYFLYILETPQHNAFQPQRGGAYCQCYHHLITRGLLSLRHDTRDQTFLTDRFMPVEHVSRPVLDQSLGSFAIAQAFVWQWFIASGAMNFKLFQKNIIYLFLISIMYIYFQHRVQFKKKIFQHRWHNNVLPYKTQEPNNSLK